MDLTGKMMQNNRTMDDSSLEVRQTSTMQSLIHKYAGGLTAAARRVAQHPVMVIQANLEKEGQEREPSPSFKTLLASISRKGTDSGEPLSQILHR
jgi:hypothetical protein